MSNDKLTHVFSPVTGDTLALPELLPGEHWHQTMTVDAKTRTVTVAYSPVPAISDDPIWREWDFKTVCRACGKGNPKIQQYGEPSTQEIVCTQVHCSNQDCPVASPRLPGDEVDTCVEIWRYIQSRYPRLGEIRKTQK